MGDQGPEYTLRRPVDIYQPLPIVFQQDDEELGGYFVQEDGMASKTRPSASDSSVRNLSVSISFLSVGLFFFFFDVVFSSLLFPILRPYSSVNPLLTLLI